MDIMNQEKLLSKLKMRWRLSAVMVGILLVSNLLLVIMLFRMERQVVLTPVHSPREMTVGRDVFSAEYLELISRDICGLIMNVTAKSWKYSADTVLKHTHPDSYAHIKQAMDRLHKEVADKELALSFAVTDIKVNTSELRVVVSGQLSTSVGSLEVTRGMYQYILEYENNGGRLMLKSFKEVIR